MALEVAAEDKKKQVFKQWNQQQGAHEWMLNPILSHNSIVLLMMQAPFLYDILQSQQKTCS